MELKVESTQQAQPSCPLSGCTRLPTAPLCRALPFYYGQRHSGHSSQTSASRWDSYLCQAPGNLQGGGRSEPQPLGSWLLAAGSTKTSRSPGSWLPTVLNCHRAPVLTLGYTRTITEPHCWKLVVRGLPQSPALGCRWYQDVALKGKECFPQGWSGQEACCCILGHASLLAGDFTLPWPRSVGDCFPEKHLSDCSSWMTE